MSGCGGGIGGEGGTLRRHGTADRGCYRDWPPRVQFACYEPPPGRPRQVSDGWRRQGVGGDAAAGASEELSEMTRPI